MVSISCAKAFATSLLAEADGGPLDAADLSATRQRAICIQWGADFGTTSVSQSRAQKNNQPAKRMR